MRQTRKYYIRIPLLNGNNHSRWPSCTIYFRSAAYDNAKIIYFFYKTSQLNEEVNCTETFPSDSFPWIHGQNVPTNFAPKLLTKEKEEKAFYNLNSRTDSRSGQNRGREGRDGRDRRPPVEDLRGRIGQAKGSGSDYKHGSLSREKERQKSRSHQVKSDACRKIIWLFDPDVKKKRRHTGGS